MSASVIHDRRDALRAWLPILLVLFVGAGFLLGRAYENRYWSIASPAKRQMWCAKEGRLEERLRRADAALRLDPEYLPAYYWKARAIFEEYPDLNAEAHQQAIAILVEGLNRSSAVDAITLLADEEADLGRNEVAALLRQTAHHLQPASER